MTVLFLVAAVVCAWLAACTAFGWFGITADYSGFLALAVGFVALSLLPWPRWRYWR